MAVHRLTPAAAVLSVHVALTAASPSSASE